MNDRILSLVLDARKAKKQGPLAILQRQRLRLADMVAYARAHSPYYRELYRELPERVEDPTLLPVTNKNRLMARYNDWVTDRGVTIEQARDFVQDQSRIGERFLKKYLALTTSGTTGTPGIFLIDDRTLAVTNALALRMLSAWLNVPDVVRIAARGGRTSMVMAIGGHFASSVAGAHLRRRLGKTIQTLSVHAPLQDLVAYLNRFRPAILAPYASMAALLANEQEAGRLRIRPVLSVLSAEGLPLAEYDRIARVFRTKVGNSYAATECMFFSYSCREKWLHVNCDWLVFEPVDADYRPTAVGQPSHTVLISNLANRIQPILRYDLGDSILQRPDPCPCGNPLPAIRVQGRSADVLVFTAEDGKEVRIPSLAFSADVAGVVQYQFVQTTRSSLSVRLRCAPSSDSTRVWEAVLSDLTRLLSEHNLANVTVQRAPEGPEQSTGGKFREVIPLSP